MDRREGAGCSNYAAFGAFCAMSQTYRSQQSHRNLVAPFAKEAAWRVSHEPTARIKAYFVGQHADGPRQVVTRLSQPCWLAWGQSTPTRATAVRGARSASQKIYRAAKRLVLLGTFTLFAGPIPVLPQSAFDAVNRAVPQLDEPCSSEASDKFPDCVLQPFVPVNPVGSVAVQNDPFLASLKISLTTDNGGNPYDAVRPVASRPSDYRVRWLPAISESLFATGVMHTFNVWTEAGTRDALNGHWFRNYTDAVSELRGWSDSDTFMAPYVGHTIEGATFGYIFRQNDPRYRNVQWGDGRSYFISLLRSMAWSAVWHTQWKIGPVSEASIGNVMLHASPGFITLVDTPTLGMIDMIAEDAADRYLVMNLENHTSNRAIIILARSFLSPGRSFANAMSFHLPWRRETRLPLFQSDAYETRKELVKAYREGSGEKPFVYAKQPSDFDNVEFVRTYPKAAPIELSAYPYFESFLGGGNCIGGGGSGAARLSPTWQFVAEVDGCLVMGFPTYNQSGDSLFYGAGLRWTPRASRRLSPFAQFLLGGRKVTYEVDNDALRTKLMAEWNNGDGTLSHYPMRSDWSKETANNGVSVAAGGGFDMVVSRPFTWRLINLEYTHTWIGDVDIMRTQRGVRLTTEAVLRIGTW